MRRSSDNREGRAWKSKFGLQVLSQSIGVDKTMIRLYGQCCLLPLALYWKQDLEKLLLRQVSTHVIENTQIQKRLLGDQTLRIASCWSVSRYSLAHFDTFPDAIWSWEGTGKSCRFPASCKLADFNLSGRCCGTDIIHKCSRWSQIGVHRLMVGQIFPTFQCMFFVLIREPYGQTKHKKSRVRKNKKMLSYRCHPKVREKQRLVYDLMSFHEIS